MTTVVNAAISKQGSMFASQLLLAGDILPELKRLVVAVHTASWSCNIHSIDSLMPDPLQVEQ